ncbi:AI-2E family transporter [Dyella monticola]|uniref:AI-2E family transporter n=1 Tax=Dyella monticola TaxID=1927958 RepID=A0A370WU38_9GAMM|nr:AI-2E family transporter [Dyella monticola]RDS79669.1 AI-2E family transporter [Dyella monticola]
MLDTQPVTPTSQRALNVVAIGVVLALLYFGKDVLVPVILALILGLLMAPFVRLLQKLRIGHAYAVLVAVLLLATVAAGLMTVIGSQIVHLAESLPQYERTVQAKLQFLHDVTVAHVQAMRGEAGRVINALSASSAGQAQETAVPAYVPSTPVLSSPWDAVKRVLSSLWSPLETAGIVLVVLVFVLLEYESLRDRFIRVIGGADLRATTVAINDGGERLSRFFVSQFAVNVGVGLLIWLGLAAIGLPNALLWGALTAVLRFVPYVGVWLAALLAGLLAAAVTPGWSLLFMTLALFAVVEVVVSQWVEPQLYGHATGLSPLAVVIAAIFWSWLWGPMGLVLSTPLTLCLVVMGRHVKAFNVLGILLGDAPALTLPQRFYQRALSGDADEIIASARIFLRQRSFARYCDAVLLPALQLAQMDLAQKAIGPQQLLKARTAVVRVIETLGRESSSQPRWRRSTSVLDEDNLGRYLRQQREHSAGRWQGPLAVAPGSIVLCLGSGSSYDDVATEILVRILRHLSIDARHISMKDVEDFAAESHPEATPNAVSMLHIVNAPGPKGRESSEAMAQEMRRRFTDVTLIAVLLPHILEIQEPAEAGPDVDRVAQSFEQAAQLTLEKFMH